MRPVAFLFAVLLAFFPTLASAQFPNISAPSSGASIPNFTANGGLAKWQACRAKVKAGTGNCVVAHIGESTGVSFDATYNGVASDALSAGYFNQIAGVLSTVYGISAQTNAVVGNHVIDGATASPSTYLTFDTRVSYPLGAAPSAWAPITSNTPALTFGGYPWFNWNTVTAFSFHPTDVVSYPSAPAILTDTIDVYNAFVNGGATLTVKVGATTICTIGPLSTFTKTTCAAPSLADNTYTLTCSVTFSCDMEMLVARNSTISQVIMLNGAFGGATMEQWTAGGASSIAPVAVIKTLQPDLCIINDLGNDMGIATPAATYQANLTTVVQACLLTGSVLLTTGVIGPTNPDGCDANCVAIRNAVIAVGAAQSVPVWDSGSIIGGPKINSNFGWNGSINGAAADANHQGAAGYAIYGTFVTQILMR